MACLATSAAFVRRIGRGALPGAVVVVAAALSFLDSHIYWPVGVLTMAGLAVGFGLLAASLPVAEREPVAGIPSRPV